MMRYESSFHNLMNPKMLRYWPLPIAARLTRGQRRLWLRRIHAAFTRRTLLPVPAG